MLAVDIQTHNKQIFSPTVENTQAAQNDDLELYLNRIRDFFFFPIPEKNLDYYQSLKKGEEETKVTLQIYTRSLYNVKNSFTTQEFSFLVVSVERKDEEKSKKDGKKKNGLLYINMIPPSFRFD